MPLNKSFQPQNSLNWNEITFQKQLEQPIISTFGLPIPHGNSLLCIVGDTIDEPLSLQSVSQRTTKTLATQLKENADSEEDFLYQKFDPTSSFYVLDVYGFYVSSRRGTKPSIITTVLRKPCSRSIAERIVWSEWEKSNPLIPQPHTSELYPQALQVERYSIPVHLMYQKFHCSVPFLQDPDLQDEYLYPFVGFKIYEKYVDIKIPLSGNVVSSKSWQKTLHPTFQENLGHTSTKNKQKSKVRFQLDASVIQKGLYSSVPNRRKENTINVYFAVSNSWNRNSLFDKNNPNYIFHNRLQLHKTNILHLTFPSLPQQLLETFLLSSPNPLLYGRLNSAYRGFTHSQTLVRQWNKKLGE